MQRKGGVKNINRSSRKKSPVECTGDAGSKVRPMLVGSQAILHGATILAVIGVVIWEELEKCVEVIGREVGEKDGELGRLVSQGLVSLSHVVDDNVDDVDGVGTAGTT